jgi:hypothetical protein
MRPACSRACTGVWNPKPIRVPTRSPPRRKRSDSRPPTCRVSRPVARDLWAEYSVSATCEGGMRAPV